MSGYTKIFSAMLNSTVWMLSKEARILWITMLLAKDRDQVVHAPIPGLAHLARLSIEETEVALAELQREDKYSQHTEYNGSRVVRVEGGWLVVNGAYYRDLMKKEARAESQAEWARNNRRKKKLAKGKPLPGEKAHEQALERGDDRALEIQEKAEELRREENGQ